MRTSSRHAWTGLGAIVSSLCLLPVLLVGVRADTGSCSCPTSAFTELEQATTGTTPENALAFESTIRSVCSTPDSDSCVAPSSCQCGTSVGIGRPATGGGTDIVCGSNEGVCVDPGANGDPHMMGLLGQTFDWAGTDGEWYSMLSDGPDLQLNVRVTAPLADFPDRQLLTAVSLIFGDGGRHSLVIEVLDPHTIDPRHDCSVLTNGNDGGNGNSNARGGDGFRSRGSCLANGALRILVDGQEYPTLGSPTAGVTLPDGDTVVSAMNLPAECQPFGGDKAWAKRFENIAAGTRHRHLRRTQSLRGGGASAASAEAKTIPLEEWILRSSTLAAPEWCAKFLEEQGVDGLLKMDSTHAIFRIDGPAITLRVNVGTNHQDYLVLPDGKSVPKVDFWQVNVGVEAGAFSSKIAGMLGETSRVVLGVGGKPVMHGLKVLGGPVENYRVSGALGVDFEQLHKSV